MPFVNIRILKGHSQERKDEISRRVSETIRDVAKLAPDAQVWVVWEDVTEEDWDCEGRSVLKALIADYDISLAPSAAAGKRGDRRCDKRSLNGRNVRWCGTGSA